MSEMISVPEQPTAEMIDAAQAVKRGTFTTVCPERVQIVERYKAMLAVAPAVRKGEPVAWYTEDHLTDKSATTWDCAVADRWRTKGWPVSQLYANADAGEVERLTRKCQNADLALSAQTENCERLRTEVERWKNLHAAMQLQRDYHRDRGEALRTRLAERDALLNKEADKYQKHADDTSIAKHNREWYQAQADALRAALSASAEPSAPKCGTCDGNGVVGWQTGQTPEQFDQGDSPCEDCNATGYAYSNGMPEPGNCPTCKGLGSVPDGEITGVEFENGPVECIKDCPYCSPVERVTLSAEELADAHRENKTVMIPDSSGALRAIKLVASTRDVTGGLERKS